jgi:hypothetical protein
MVVKIPNLTFQKNIAQDSKLLNVKEKQSEANRHFTILCTIINECNLEI